MQVRVVKKMEKRMNPRFQLVDRNFLPQFRMKKLAMSALLASSLCALGYSAHAGEEEPIVTDRPDFVESSDVVGKGRVQIETGLSIDRKTEGGIKTRTITTPTLIRVGISDKWELRAESDGRTWERTENVSTGAVSSIHGYSDFAVGAKYHVADAVGAMPSLGVLTHFDIAAGSTAFRGKGVRPSVRLVGEWELPNEMSLGVMPGLIYDRNEADARYFGGILGVVVGKSWSERVRTFVELSFPQIANKTNGGSSSSLDVGAALLLDKNVQLDVVLSQGLNKNAPDFTLGVGLSARF
jgi:hypothetical protein